MDATTHMNADTSVKHILSIKSFVSATIFTSGATLNLLVITSLGFHIYFSTVHFLCPFHHTSFSISRSSIWHCLLSRLPSMKCDCLLLSTRHLLSKILLLFSPFLLCPLKFPDCYQFLYSLFHVYWLLPLLI